MICFCVEVESLQSPFITTSNQLTDTLLPEIFRFLFVVGRKGNSIRANVILIYFCIVLIYFINNCFSYGTFIFL